MNFNELTEVKTTKKRATKKRATKETIRKPRSDLGEKRERRKTEIVSISRIGEPGLQVATAKFKTVAQECEKCEDIKTHFLTKNKQIIMCSQCGHKIKVKDNL